MASRFHFRLGLLLLAVSIAAPWSPGKELLDRVAITVGLEVITEQEIYEQVRIAAFLDGRAPAFTQQALRDTADRMVMQRLLLLDMRANGFPMPEEEELEERIAASKAEHWGSPEAFEQGARDAGLDPIAVRLFLRAMLATEKYVNFRFRSSVRISESALLERYLQQYPPSEERDAPEPPEFEQVRDALEAALEQETMNQTIDRWLEDARARAGLRYMPEVLP
ncbi:MAG: hypothetical protein MUF01_05140 [Bryobacterales bacterium]|jgi:parvulin-like peptidyl-prolyl isomerase|nr:hypothetical protein [Bryobacterales bacterium]